jgi:CheY-like chemotaxis protein
MTTRSVLVIDDDDDVRAIARLCLETVGGYQVRTASGGELGVESAAADPPDAILLDVMMPGMDGLTTFSRLRARAVTRAIPVVLLTAKVSGVDVTEIEEMGVAGMITKPFDAMGLPHELARIVGWRT